MQLFITGIFLFILDLIFIGSIYVFGADIKSPSITNSTVPVRLVKGNQKIQIGDREPYIAYLTTLVFDEPQCISALKIDALSPLTGAEEIEIIYTLCSEGDSSWQLVHYENQKNVYILRNPVSAKRISVLNGKGNISIVDIDFKLCSNMMKSIEMDENSITCKPKHQNKKWHKKRHRHVSTIKLPDEEVFIRHRIKRATDEELFNNAISDEGCVSGNCVCEPGWSGPLCLVPDCSMVSNCSKNGICLRPGECQCTPGFTGIDCSKCIGMYCSGNASCDYNCVHGKCDMVTKSCVCQDNWSGAACDICPRNNCLVRPELSLILPQTGDVNNPNVMIYVHGSDFPQGQSPRYNCLFGGIATQGLWLSSSLIRCPTPPRARPEKHAFNVVPYGTSEYIPYEDDRTLHFTFFAPCDPKICRGSCLGPSCICEHAQTGPTCEFQKNSTENSIKFIEEPAVIRATEGKPYVVAIPNQDHDSVINIDSPIKDLIINLFDKTLRWDNPIGSDSSYPISLKIYSQNVQTELRWNLTVDPIYFPIISKIGNTSDSNKVVLHGYVDKKENGGVKNLPIEIEIYNGTEFLESRTAYANDGIIFKYEVLPYITYNVLYVARAKHPGTSNETSPYISWTIPKIRMSYDEVIRIANETFSLTYKAYTDGLTCNWKISIIEPSAKFLILQHKVTEGNIQNLDISFLTTLKFPFLTVEFVLLFNCDGVNGFVTRQAIMTEVRGDIISFQPEQIYIAKYSNKEPQLVSIIVTFHKLISEINGSITTDNSLYPFYLISSDPPISERIASNTTLKMTLGLSSDYTNNVGSLDGILHFPNVHKPIFSIPYRIRKGTYEGLNFVLIIKNVIEKKGENGTGNEAIEVQVFNTDRSLFYSKVARMNAPTEFYPTPAGYYQIVTKSTEYEPYSEIVKITPDMNTLTIYLHPKSPLYAVFDKENLDQETILPNEETFTTLTLTPSVFTSRHINEEIFVDIVYENGLNDSFIVINGVQSGNIGPFGIEFPKLDEPLCLSCGLRVPIRLIQTEDDPILWNDVLKCNIYRIPISYTLYVDGATKNEKFNTNIYVDFRRDFTSVSPIVCQNSTSIESPPIAGKTIVQCNCPATKLEKCRHLYQPMQACSTYWKDIPDDTISIYSWALFLLLRVDCKFSGIDFDKVRKLIDCVASIDSACPVNIGETNQNHHQQNYGQFFNQISALQPIKSGFQNYFPALSTVEAQLINFPMLFMDFMNHFDRFIPETLIEKIDDMIWFDAFFKIVSDESDKGQMITMDELLMFEDWKLDRELILKWNQTLYELNGDNPDLQYKQPGNTIYEFRKLVEKADQLKSISRQFGSSNPFTMLHDVFNTIFSKLSTSQNTSTTCALGYVYIEPNKVKEGDEFEVTAVIINTLENESLQNVHLNLEIFPTNSKSPNIQYRLGPVFYSGISARDETINFMPGSKLVVKWRAAPVLESRLIEETEQQPQVNLYYERNGQRLAHRLNSPSFKILPKKTLRIFAFAYPTVFSTQQRGDNRPFTFMLSFMNTGYTTLESIKILELSPWIVHFNDTSRNLDYKFQSISLNGRTIPNNPYFIMNQIASGEAINLAMNLSTLKELGLFQNVSIAVKIGEELPSHVDFRFFLIHQALSSNTIIITEAIAPFQLYYYETQASKIVALQHIQLIEKKQEDREANGKPYRSILVAYRRIPTEGKEYRGPILGSLSFSNLPENFQLIRVSELLPGIGVQQRVLNMNDVWTVKDTDETTSINFIDLQASNASPQLIYEFIFGNPNDFTSPYFSQNFYRVQLRPEAWPEENTILGTIPAVSPLGIPLSYTLVSNNNIPYFQIDPKNGKIVLTQPLPKNATEFCFNIITTDTQDQKTAVPVVINTGGRRGSCSVYKAGTPVYQHLFSGDTSNMKEMSQSWVTSMLMTTKSAENGDMLSTLPMITPSGVEVSLENTPEENMWTYSITPRTLYPLETPISTTIPPSITIIPPGTENQETQSQLSQITPASTLEVYSPTTGAPVTMPTEEEEIITENENPGRTTTERSTSILWPTNPTETDTDFPTPEPITWISNPDQTLSPLENPDDNIELESTMEISTVPTVEISPYILEGISPSSRSDVRIEKITLSPKQQAGFTTTDVTTTTLPSTTMTFMSVVTNEIMGSTLMRTSTSPPIISYTEESREMSDSGVKTIVLTTNPTTTAMPLVTRLTLIPTIPTVPASKFGSILPSFSPSSQQTGESHYSSVIDMACRLKDTKPIWGVVCDMAKTVHFKAM